MTDDIVEECPLVVRVDVHLLVPVGVELNPSLLHSDLSVVLLPVKCRPCDVSTHLAHLRGQEGPRLQSEAQILVERRTEVLQPERRQLVVEDAHFGPVVRTLEYLGRRVLT